MVLVLPPVRHAARPRAGLLVYGGFDMAAEPDVKRAFLDTHTNYAAQALAGRIAA